MLFINMTVEEIQSRLKTKRFGKTIFHFESLPSTNTYAKSLTSNGVEEGTIVIADQQTAGHGRLGRHWHAEPGKNLTFSLIIRPDLPPGQIGLVSLYTSIAVTQALTLLTPLHIKCKWPNDVIVNSKKCCGILSEATFTNGTISYITIGIGINVNQHIFPPDIATSATSLFLETGKHFDRISVLCKVLEEMESLYPLLTSGRAADIIKKWQGHTAMLGTRVSINQNGNSIQGTAVRLAEDGGLVVVTDHGEVKILAGDVNLYNANSLPV